jgi:hypothetical protein
VRASVQDGAGVKGVEKLNFVVLIEFEHEYFDKMMADAWITASQSEQKKHIFVKK